MAIGFNTVLATNLTGTSSSVGFATVAGNYYLLTLYSTQVPALGSNTQNITYTLLGSSTLPGGAKTVYLYGGLCTGTTSGSVTVTHSVSATFSAVADAATGVVTTSSPVLQVSTFTESTTLDGSANFAPFSGVSSRGYVAIGLQATSFASAGDWTALQTAFSVINTSPGRLLTFKNSTSNTSSTCFTATAPYTAYCVVGVEFGSPPGTVEFSNSGVGSTPITLSNDAIIVDTSVLYPTVGAQVAGATASWVNPGNITASDNTRATLTFPGAGSITASNLGYLNATGYGFALPSNATVVGITVGIEMLRNGGAAGEARTETVQMFKAGTRVGSNYSTATNVATTEAIRTYGSDTDLWGTTWTYSDINDANFGVSMRPVGSTAATSRVLNVDAITVKVRYITPPAPPGPSSFVYSNTGAGTNTVVLRNDSTTTGWLNPQTTAGAWTNPNNVFASDNTRATQVIASGTEGAGLYAYNFDGLSVPAGATITSIDARYEGSVTAGALDYAYVFIASNNSFAPICSASAASLALTGTESVVQIGGDLWGGADTNNNNAADRAWLASDFNSTLSLFTAFGAGAPAGATVSLDNIQLRVNYSQAGSTAYSNTGVGTTASVLTARTSLAYSNTGTGTTTYTLAAGATLAYSNTGAGANTYALAAGVSLAYSNVGTGTNTYAFVVQSSGNVSYSNVGSGTNTYVLSADVSLSLSYSNVGTGANTYSITLGTAVTDITDTHDTALGGVKKRVRKGLFPAEPVIEQPIFELPPLAPIFVPGSQEAIDALANARKLEADQTLANELAAIRAQLALQEELRLAALAEQARLAALAAEALRLKNEEEEQALILVLLAASRRRGVFNRRL